MRQASIIKCVRFFITKCDSFITKCDDFITKCDSYYKMRRLLQNATVHSKNNYLREIKEIDAKFINEINYLD